MRNKPIILIAGDPKSIFFEILFKSLKKKEYQSPLVLICSKELLNKQMKKFKFKKSLRILNNQELKNLNLNNNSINLIDVKLGFLSFKKHNKKIVHNYIEKSFNHAFKIIRDRVTNKLINGPINKKTFLNKKYPGVTEYISTKFNNKKIGMLIYNKKLSVCPLTTHLPIKLVAKKINKKLVAEKLDIIDKFFRKNFNIKPKIAVTGMNPHCETTLKYNEDDKILRPVIKKKFNEGVKVSGPYPADTIFLTENRKKFDVILGMYHDQVLGPFKTLFEYDAINITMGLPFLRVSPDHGPNQKMFGQNKSNPQSLINALDFLDNK
tara:strand:+ start:60 stop:1025 length:966 start_codon:yes stop_codon:yes gene_type:complete